MFWMMTKMGWVAGLVVLLVALPPPAVSEGLGMARECGPCGTPGVFQPALPIAEGLPGKEEGRSFWLPAGGLTGLPGVEEARAAQNWVSGEPLLATGRLRLEESGGGGEGGAGGRAMELKLVGSHCKIYVDSNAKPYPSNATLKSLAGEFDDRIWPNDTATFGSIIFNSININIINMDGAWGVGGYFTAADPNSIYMDCADLNSWGYQIAAHEFEHLIHNQKDPDEELWVNEGCADIAIAVIYGVNDGTITGHVDGFEGTPDNDLTVFQNEMHDYGSTYAFVQYFWDRFGGPNAVKALVANKSNGIQGINDTLESLGYSRRFQDIFPQWCVANRLDDSSLAEGQFGYASLNIHVNLAGDWSSLPVSFAGDVHRWASDCYRFRGGNALDLLVNFTAFRGSYTPRLAGQGQSGTNSTVLEIPLDTAGFGEGLLYAFGRDYSEATLFTPSSTGGNFTLGARQVDRTPPTTSAAVSPAEPDGKNGWYVLSPTITVHSNEETARLFFWWDEPPELNYTGPLTAPDGDHTLWFYSMDASGNRDANHSLHFKVDTMPPSTRMTVNPESPDGKGGWYITGPTIELGADENASIYYYWDGEPARNYTGPVVAPEGRYRLEFYSIDEAGNEGNTTTREFLVDTQAPGARANLTPPKADGLGGWYRTPPTIVLESDEPGSRLLYRWDNSSEATYLRPLVAPEGVHRLQYRAQDAAGNNGSRQELQLWLDTLPPELSVGVEPRSPDGKLGWYRTRPGITIQVIDDDPSATALYCWDSSDFRPYVGPLKAPEGVHTLRCRAMDSRGNAGNESSRTFKVDSIPPVTRVRISPVDLGDDWYRQAPEVDLSTDEGAGVWYWWDDGAPSLFSGPIESEEGEHDLSFQARDPAGNTERARLIHFRVDTSPPEAQLDLSAASLAPGDILAADASGSSDGNGVEHFSIDFGDGARKSGAVSSWEHQYEAPGVYMVTLKVRDFSGLWSEPVQANVTVVLPPRPPAPPEKKSPQPFSPTVLGVLTLGLVVAAASAAFLRRRRSGREE